MYSTNDIGSVAIICLVMCSLVAMAGVSEMWPIVGGLVVVIATSLMLAK
jgi:hypothetical protein